MSIYLTEEHLNKPASELVEDVRNGLNKLRGQLWEIKDIYGHKDWIEFAEGSMTCLIMALHLSIEEIKKVETK